MPRVILVDSTQTGSAFSLTEQEAPAGNRPPPHTPLIDEWFNVLGSGPRRGSSTLDRWGYALVSVSL